ncbi:carboxypeptidase family protein [Geothermobacter ehrlichii]|uniref:Carboxypeptidase family protein n=1 Tax=Geothermobacter ehrlichii TaxID=213224 RepID=A0A5D3WG33_9BACT|nr:carboxypeptidase regulatory-like domain-containing protein [Geothermobacter ehrlichii]TYO97125.1 carboxypeptidase family protein [Geothermobacter ehrlichii]
MKRFLPLLLACLFLLPLGCQQEQPQTEKPDLVKVSGRVMVPLEGAYIYIYQKGMDLYGPAMTVSKPTDAEGRFELSLPPGEYIAVARKRKNGEMAGPVLAGDNKSEFINLDLEAQPVQLTVVAPVKVGDERRLSTTLPAGKTGLSGTIRDAEGKPVAGARVHVYDHVQMSERPKFVSEKTGPDGRYLIYLPKGGTYYLAARDKFGGPPQIGDLYGRYDQGTIEPSAVVVKDGEILENIDITVTKVW